MLYIIHGDDTVSSTKKMLELLLGQKNVSTFNAEKLSSAELEQAFTSQDLFADSKFLVFEKFLKFKKAEMDKLIQLLTKCEKSISVILWHNTELSKVALSKFENPVVHTYMLPKHFFAFLDNLSPKSIKQELKTLSEMEGVEAEQIFYAAVKRIRQLIYVQKGIQSEEVSKISAWQMGKLTSQAALWSGEELSEFYKALLNTEIKMKSGGLVLPLKKELDRMLILELH